MRVTQEADRVPGKAILATAAGVVAASAIGVLAAYYIRDCHGAALARARPPAVYIEPAPRFEPAPIGQVPEEVNAIEQVLFRERAPGLEERAAERTTLRSYAWADRDAGLVRIPIDRAIELYVQRQRAQQPAQRPEAQPAQQPAQQPEVQP